jgi:hypothetical protein
MEAPTSAGLELPLVPAGRSRHLAYYRSEALGVLAPRGWSCFGTYGSSGTTLYVAPKALDVQHLLNPERTSGPAIVISRLHGDTSGRMAVAEIAARVFPAYREFVLAVQKDFDAPGRSFEFGPFSGDTLTYRRANVVEFRTPPQSEGLGTYWYLGQGLRPVRGVAILVDPDAPDLVFLTVRLPVSVEALTDTIVGQVEAESHR